MRTNTNAYKYKNKLPNTHTSKHINLVRKIATTLETIMFSRKLCFSFKVVLLLFLFIQFCLGGKVSQSNNIMCFGFVCCLVSTTIILDKTLCPHYFDNSVNKTQTNTYNVCVVCCPPHITNVKRPTHMLFACCLYIYIVVVVSE